MPLLSRACTAALAATALYTVSAHADLQDVPDSTARQLVEQYVALHRNPTHANMAALLSPDCVVLSSKGPPEGRSTDDYLQFLQRFRWATFAPDSDSPLSLTNDGRIVLPWTMRFWGVRLARGIDYLTVRDGRIHKIVAVY